MALWAFMIGLRSHYSLAYCATSEMASLAICNWLTEPLLKWPCGPFMIGLRSHYSLAYCAISEMASWAIRNWLTGPLLIGLFALSETALQAINFWLTGPLLKWPWRLPILGYFLNNHGYNSQALLAIGPTYWRIWPKTSITKMAISTKAIILQANALLMAVNMMATMTITGVARPSGYSLGPTSLGVPTQSRSA